MLSLSVIPRHPRDPIKTISRMVFRFFSTMALGVRTDLAGPRSGAGTPTTRIAIPMSGAIVPRIRQDIEETPSGNPFWATLAFELMDGGKDYKHPYFELPATGPYKNFGAVNALGMRVEWKHYTLQEWFSAPLQISGLRRGRARRGLQKGDPTPMLRLYQEAIAIIQVLRGQDCPQAPPGFWRSLGSRGSRPVIRKLDVNHLEQTIQWAIHPPSQAPVPEKATLDDNRPWLDNIGAELKTINRHSPLD